MKKNVTLAELENELQLQKCEQERLGDFTLAEREWFAKGEELSAEAERWQIAARQRLSD